MSAVWLFIFVFILEWKGRSVWRLAAPSLHLSSFPSPVCTLKNIMRLSNPLCTPQETGRGGHEEKGGPRKTNERTNTDYKWRYLSFHVLWGKRERLSLSGDLNESLSQNLVFTLEKNSGNSLDLAIEKKHCRWHVSLYIIIYSLFSARMPFIRQFLKENK